MCAVGYCHCVLDERDSFGNLIPGRITSNYYKCPGCMQSIHPICGVRSAKRYLVYSGHERDKYSTIYSRTCHWCYFEVAPFHGEWDLEGGTDPSHMGEMEEARTREPRMGIALTIGSICGSSLSWYPDKRVLWFV